MVPFAHCESIGFALYFLNRRQKLCRTFNVALQIEASASSDCRIVMTQASFANIKLLKRGAAAIDNSAPKDHTTFC